MLKGEDQVKTDNGGSKFVQSLGIHTAKSEPPLISQKESIKPQVHRPTNFFERYKRTLQYVDYVISQCNLPNGFPISYDHVWKWLHAKTLVQIILMPKATPRWIQYNKRHAFVWSNKRMSTLESATHLLALT